MVGAEVDVVDGHGRRETPIKHQVRCRFLFICLFCSTSNVAPNVICRWKNCQSPCSE